MSAVSRRVLPGFGLILGYTVTALDSTTGLNGCWLPNRRFSLAMEALSFPGRMPRWMTRARCATNPVG